VNDTAVVAGLVPAELGLLVEEGHCRLGFDLQQSAGDRDAQDPAAHHADSPPHFSPPDSYDIQLVARLVVAGDITSCPMAVRVRNPPSTTA
jgi:hypothetical protein